MIYTQAYHHYTNYNISHSFPKHYTRYVIYVVTFILFKNPIMWILPSPLYR